MRDALSDIVRILLSSIKAQNIQILDNKMLNENTLKCTPSFIT